MVNVRDLPWETARYPDEDFDRGECQDIGGALGSRTIGANVHRLAPGQENARYHAHEFEEELFVVLEGRPTLRLDGRAFHLSKGHVVYCPPWSAHTFRNESDDSCSILMTSNRCGRADAVYPLWKAEPRPEDLRKGLDPRDERVRHLAELGWENDPFGREWGGCRNLSKVLGMKAIGAEIRTLRPGALVRYQALTAAELIYIVQEGVVEILKEGGQGVLREGDAIWFPPGAGHAFRVREHQQVRIFGLMDQPPSGTVEYPTPPSGWKEPVLL